MLNTFIKIQLPSAIKLNLVLSLAFSSLLIGCAQTPKAPEMAVQASEVSPLWLKQLPSNPEHFYAVGSTIYVDQDLSNAQQVAIKVAQQSLNDNIHQTLQKIPSTHPLKGDLIMSELEKQLRLDIKQAIRYPFLTEFKLEETFADPKSQQVFVLVSVPKQAEKTLLEARLVELDQQLKEYQHASQKGSALTQLMSLIPVLPTLEERNQINNAIKALMGEPPALANEQMALMMDRQITQLMNSLIFNVDALTAETEKLEPYLVSALTHSDFTVSARRPDLNLKYYIELDMVTEGTENQVNLVNDIEFINRDSSIFGHFNETVQITAQTSEKAKEQAFAILATKIKLAILNKLKDQITLVNQTNHGR